MPSQASPYTTKELSKKTWPDFVKLFTQGNGWDFCWCMHYQRPCGQSGHHRLHRAERSVKNRREKKGLVETGHAHGIIVYAKREPVGWCQYGPQEELPRIDKTRKYQGLAPQQTTKPLWRITCFAVLKPYRKRGVGSAALKAVLESIKKKGGGLVEGYPISRWESRAFGNESTHGTASMFEKAGFKKVAPFGSNKFSTSVLMRRSV
jgi:GNAT superfamily N-acetyltransferase